MEISVKKQLEKQPNTWISKSLTVLFILLLIVWASKGINFRELNQMELILQRMYYQELYILM